MASLQKLIKETGSDVHTHRGVSPPPRSGPVEFKPDGRRGQLWIIFVAGHGVRLRLGWLDARPGPLRRRQEAPCKGKLSPHRETFSGSAPMTAIEAHPAQVQVQGRHGFEVDVSGNSRRDLMRLTHAMQGPQSDSQAASGQTGQAGQAGQAGQSDRDRERPPRRLSGRGWSYSQGWRE